MTQYRKGADFERLVRTDLLARELDVIRSAGSKTKVDLVAFGAGQCFVIQCKLAGVISKDEWDEFYALAQRGGARPILAMKGPRGTPVQYYLLTGRKLPYRKLQYQPAIEYLP